MEIEFHLKDSIVNSTEYALGDSASAARRLALQDEQFAAPSEQLLDQLQIQPTDRVVELGIGPGSFGRRIMQRLGAGGVLVGVDYTQDLLDQAVRNLANCSEATFEPVLGDIRELGPWLANADVIVGRTVLHHIPLVETLIGRMLNALPSGTRLGFIEPEFRAMLARITALEARGRTEMTPLRVWAEGIIRFYTLRDLSPAIGSIMHLAFEAAKCRDIQSWWHENPTDDSVLENMLLYYDEVRDKYGSMGIMTSEEIDEQQAAVRALTSGLPAVWGVHCLTCRVPG